MFVKVFTEDTINADYWPATFYYENSIRASLIEDGHDLHGLTATELRDAILTLGQGIRFPADCPDPKPPKEWVDCFFERECPQLANFLCETIQSKESRVNPTAPQLSIDINQIQHCVARSPSFRDFLSESAALWSG